MNFVKKEVLLREYEEKLRKKYVVLERGGVRKLVRRYQIGPFTINRKITIVDGYPIQSGELKEWKEYLIKGKLDKFRATLTFKSDSWKEVE